jgi:hypothetical protein
MDVNCIQNSLKSMLIIKGSLILLKNFEKSANIMAF